MGYTDKAKNQAQQMKGKAKEWIGDKTDNDRMEAEGAQDQASARMKQNADQMAEKMKDKGPDMTQGMPGR